MSFQPELTRELWVVVEYRENVGVGMRAWKGEGYNVGIVS